MRFEFSNSDPGGDPMVVSLYNEKDSLPVGWAFVTIDDRDPTSCLLWMIHVRNKYRRAGYGRALIANLQSQFSTILTHYETSVPDEPGPNLCLACGFKPKPSMFKKHSNRLVWKGNV